MNAISRCLTALALIGWSGCAMAQIYSLTELSPSSSATANAVNASGQVAGTNSVGPFLYSDGVMQDLNTGSGIGPNPGQGLNDGGQVTGSYVYSGGGEFHAFIYSNGVLQDLGAFPGLPQYNWNSDGYGINDSGQVTGWSDVPSLTANAQHAFLYSNGVMQDLGTLGGDTFSVGYAINASGQVTGYDASTQSDTVSHAFLYSNGAMQNIDTLGGTSGQGYGINASGQVVGQAQTSDGAYHAFLYSNGLMTDLGTLGGTASIALGISDSGQVVGDAPNAAGAGRAFLYSNGQMVDLNSLIDPNSPLAPYVTLTVATGISSTGGYIAANGTDSRYPGVTEPFLVALEPNMSPSVTPVITGKRGNNGWYISTTTLAWTITGNPVPATSGCGKVSVPQTKGTSYTCSATNSLGNASTTVTIKEDSVKPSVVIKKPAANAVYALKQNVLASYSCLDATSGVATCAGTVADGASINTSTLGTLSFTVTGTDYAGNKTKKTVLYTVEPPTATPVFSLKAGTYIGAQSVTISDATAAAVIYYTLDGTTPTTSSSVYAGAISISTTETLKADAIATGYTRSAVKTAAYTIQ